MGKFDETFPRASILDLVRSRRGAASGHVSASTPAIDSVGDLSVTTSASPSSTDIPTSTPPSRLALTYKDNSVSLVFVFVVIFLLSRY